MVPTIQNSMKPFRVSDGGPGEVFFWEGGQKLPPCLASVGQKLSGPQSQCQDPAKLPSLPHFEPPPPGTARSLPALFPGDCGTGVTGADALQDMDYSRIIERLLKLAVSTPAGPPALWGTHTASPPPPFIPHGFCLPPTRSPTTSFGSSSSTGSSTPA